MVEGSGQLPRTPGSANRTAPLGGPAKTAQLTAPLPEPPTPEPKPGATQGTDALGSDASGVKTPDIEARERSGAVRRAPVELDEPEEAAPQPTPTPQASAPEPPPEPPAPPAPEPPKEQPSGIRAKLSNFFHTVGEVADVGLDALGDGTKYIASGVGQAGSVVAGGLGGLTSEALHVVGLDNAAKKVEGATAATQRTVENIGNSVGTVIDKGLDTAGHLAHDVGDVAGAAVSETESVTEVLADKTLGPRLPAYAKEGIPGTVGAISSRLPPGQSAFVSAGFKGTVPSEVLGLPNTGGNVTVTTAVKRTQDGKVQVVLTGEATATATYEASAYGAFKITAFDKSVGVEAGAYARAGSEASNTYELTLTFDPKNPADVARMGQIFKDGAPGQTSLDVTSAAFKQAREANFESLEVGGRFGAVAAAGVFVEAGTEKTREEELAELRKEAKNGYDPTALETSISKTTGLRVGADAQVSVRAGVGGGIKTFRDGSTESRVRFDASGSAELAATGATPGTTLRAGHKRAYDADETLVFRKGPDGALESLAVESTQVKPLGPTTITEVVKRTLTPEGMRQAREMMAQGMRAPDAFMAAAQDPANLSFEKRTITKNSFTLFAVQGVAALGAKAEVGGELTLGTGSDKTESMTQAQYEAAKAKQDTVDKKYFAQKMEKGDTSSITGETRRAGTSVSYDAVKNTIDVTGHTRKNYDGTTTVDLNTGEFRFKVAAKGEDPKTARDGVSKAEKQKRKNEYVAEGQLLGDYVPPPKPRNYTVLNQGVNRGIDGTDTKKERSYTSFATKFTAADPGAAGAAGAPPPDDDPQHRQPADRKK